MNHPHSSLPQDQLLAAIVGGTDDAIYAKDLDGRIVYWNDAATRLYGYDSAEILGTPVSVLIPDELRGEERVIIERVREGERIEHYATRRQRRDGEIVHVSLTVTGMLDDRGEVMAASVIARDVTESVELAALREANVMKDNFVAFVAHEFRTPMTSISGFVSLLLQRWEEFDETDKHRFLTIVDQQTTRLSMLIDDLLTLSAVEAAGERLQGEPTGIVRAIRSALVELGREDITVTCPDEAVALASDGHLRQMLLNLISNAIKYGAEPIDISVTCGDAMVGVTVHDNGPGVPPSFRDQLFERFSRSSSALRSEAVGSGLGLSIVEALARAYGGSARYLDGDGATFTVELPRALT